MSSVFALVLVLAGAAVSRLVSGEIAAWLPTMSRKIVASAAKRLRDADLAKRYAEEWEAAVAEIPGPLSGLVHAMSLWCHVREVERSYAAEVSAADVEERFEELEQAVLVFRERFDDALASNGLTLEDIARVTKVSLRDLMALRRGDWKKMSIGYMGIFAYLSDLPQLLGAALVPIHQQYSKVLSMSGGLPPASATTPRQRALRWFCGLIGHMALERHIHGKTSSSFHWSYRRCERCGDVSLMRSEPCNGRRIRVKRDFNQPIEEIFDCENDYSWESSSLEAPHWQPSIGKLRMRRPCLYR